MIIRMTIQVALFLAVAVPFVRVMTKLVRREHSIPADRGPGADVARGRAATGLTTNSL